VVRVAPRVDLAAGGRAAAPSQRGLSKAGPCRGARRLGRWRALLVDVVVVEDDAVVRQLIDGGRVHRRVMDADVVPACRAPNRPSSAAEASGTATGLTGRGVLQGGRTVIVGDDVEHVGLRRRCGGVEPEGSAEAEQGEQRHAARATKASAFTRCPSSQHQAWLLRQPAMQAAALPKSKIAALLNLRTADDWLVSRVVDWSDLQASLFRASQQ
jgi:hypothetical protein